MQSHITRHVGKLYSTGRKVAVVMMSIHGREDHALICDSETLPMLYEQQLMSIIESREGQASESLADAMSRKLMMTQAGERTVLQAFHEAGFLRAIPTSDVAMMPRPNMVKSLKEINDSIKNMNSDPLMEQEVAVPQTNDPADVKFNPMEHNMNVSQNDDKVSVANGLLLQAEMLEKDAMRLREKAYAQVPSLRPAPSTPKVSEPTEVKITETKPAAKKRGRPKKQAS